jgi:N6-L-threonylcarbamoyladenine synthase
MYKNRPWSQEFESGGGFLYKKPKPTRLKEIGTGMTKTVLGIETSCDETAVALVTDAREILANLVLSQKEHVTYGGVVPEVAARAHLHHIDHLVEEALDVSGKTLADVDAIAVTAGPGLIGGVLVGVMTAKAMAAVRDIPLIGVNHLEGHALTVRLTHDDVTFPYLLLLVSGGHCQILVVEGVGRYKRLGTTIDDAVGEAFDKTAKLMGLGWPGGPAVEKLAATCMDPAKAKADYPLPRPLVGKEGCDFSFSGLKTAVRRVIEDFPAGAIPQQRAADLCCAFQQTVAEILKDRINNAIGAYMQYAPAAPTLVVAGGVAANKMLRAALEDLCAEKGLRFVAPPLKLCTDNAAMIAWAGMERFLIGDVDAPDFPVRARWPLDPDAGVVAAKSQKV